MKTKARILTVIGVAGYVVWALMAYLDPTVRSGFLNFNITMAMGSIGLVLRDMEPGSSAKKEFGDGDR